MENYFKIRCSAISQIMTNPKAKSDPISKTALTYLETYVKEQLYDRKNEFISKYCSKGVQVEQESIDFIGNYLGIALFKNQKHYENKFLTGTPDVVLKEYGIEVKNSWDCFTFPLFETEPPSNYYYQCQGYMALTGLSSWKLIYTLMDAPEFIITSEAKRYSWSIGESELEMELYEEFVRKMTYSNVPDNFRIKTFEIQRNDDVINAIYERVELCRNYLPKI